MPSLIISKINETYISISGESHIIQELDDSFSFFADGYKYHPKYKSKIWDGKIRLIRRKSQNIAHVYYGLLDSIITFCKSHDYQYELNSNLISDNNVSNEDLIKYIHSLKVSSKGTIINPRDYQIKGFIDCIVNKRQLIISATSSGKSLIIYLICRYLESMNLKGLLIVPNISLIHQIYNDFDDYSSLNGWLVEDHVHKIFSGQEKITDKNLVLSTWQSLMNIKSKDYFSQFDFTIVDECFSGTTKILTRDGYIEIKNIKIGDVVINYNEKEKTFKEDVVEKIHKNISKNEKMYELEFDNNVKIKVTGNHKFLTNNGWVRADELTEEHEIINYEKKT